MKTTVVLYLVTWTDGTRGTYWDPPSRNNDGDLILASAKGLASEMVGVLDLRTEDYPPPNEVRQLKIYTCT